MKVFLSWSGERSREIAVALRDWLPKVIQSVQPWMSSVDIDRGARWSTDIATQLEQARFGILCLTPENIDAPWILFEAGALSKTLDRTFVCPYLFDLEPSDLKGPLVQFNAAMTNKSDTEKLIQTINVLQENSLSQENFQESFELWWPKLEEKLSQILPFNAKAKIQRPFEEMIEEILEIVRAQERRTDLSDASVVEVVDYSPADSGDFLVGQRVRHPKYGNGLVIKREGVGIDSKLTITFPGYGTKKMIQKFSSLKKV
jgi:TIR domain